MNKNIFNTPSKNSSTLMNQISNKKELARSIDLRSRKKVLMQRMSERIEKKLPTLGHNNTQFHTSRLGRRKSSNNVAKKQKGESPFIRPLARKTYDVRNIQSNSRHSNQGEFVKVKTPEKNMKSFTDKSGNFDFGTNPKLIFLTKKYKGEKSVRKNLPDVTPKSKLSKANFSRSNINSEKDSPNFVKSTNARFHFKTLAKFTTPGKMDGVSKVNQDKAVVMRISMPVLKSSFFSSEIMSLIAVFDGHGSNGHHVSQFLVENLKSKLNLFLKLLPLETLIRGIQSMDDNSGKETQEKSLSSVMRSNIRSHLDSNTLDPKESKELRSKLKLDYYELLDSVCTKLNQKLRHSRIQSFLSGSTGVMLMAHDGKIITANVGDSRAVLFVKKSKDTHFLKEIELTVDHTPSIPSEKRRVIKAGGEIKRVLGKIPT